MGYWWYFLPFYAWLSISKIAYTHQYHGVCGVSHFLPLNSGSVQSIKRRYLKILHDHVGLAASKSLSIRPFIPVHEFEESASLSESPKRREIRIAGIFSSLPRIRTWLHPPRIPGDVGTRAFISFPTWIFLCFLIILLQRIFPTKEVLWWRQHYLAAARPTVLTGLFLQCMISYQVFHAILH